MGLTKKIGDAFKRQYEKHKRAIRVATYVSASALLHVGIVLADGVHEQLERHFSPQTIAPISLEEAASQKTEFLNMLVEDIQDSSLDEIPYSRFMLQAEWLDDNEQALASGKKTKPLDDYVDNYASF